MQDPFTSYYDAKVVADFVALLQKLTYKPVLLPFKPNGKALHVKGFLNRFAKTAQNQADVLSRLAKLGIPMVGVDPAIVLTYRDEYKEILGQARGDFEVLTSQEWLTSQQTQLQTLIQKFCQNRPHLSNATMVFIFALYRVHRIAQQWQRVATTVCLIWTRIEN